MTCHIGTPGYAFGPGTTSSTPLNITTQHGYECPKGTYCPAGTSVPYICPIGTFQPLLGQVNSSACTLCDAGTYQYESGQASCFKCSSSSTSDIGSALCTCVGKNRAFQPGDGYCICSPGYEFVNSNLVVSSEDDGSYDCQPVVYSRCVSTQVRNLDGKCVDANGYCIEVCGVSGGVFSDTTGTCQCNDVIPLSAVCDTACRSSAPTMSCGNTSTSTGGHIIVTINGVVSTLSASTFASAGALSCTPIPGGSSAIYSMSTTTGKMCVCE